MLDRLTVPSLSSLLLAWLSLVGATSLAASAPGAPGVPTSDAGLASLAVPAGNAAAAAGRVLRVGPTRAYSTPSEAAEDVRDGDVVEIDAGVYPGDVAVWRADGITLRGVGDGRAHLRADGSHAEGKAIWVIKGDNVRVENIEFSGARVPDRNGAGIRQEGKNLVVHNCYFHDNEVGILAGDHSRSKIVIEHSVFYNNHRPDGHNHNVYINHVKRFIFRYNHVHGAQTGHNVKSRAKKTFILYNRIGDEDDGTSSYAIDLSNGGRAFVIGNVIHEGEDSENSTAVAFGPEGFDYRRNDLYFVHNTVVSERSSVTFVRTFEEPRRLRILNNLFVGRGSLELEGDPQLRGNLESVDDPGFVDPDDYDYRLLPGSPAIDAGVKVSPRRVRPKFQYVHPADREKRPKVGEPDVGAYEREPVEVGDFEL